METSIQIIKMKTPEERFLKYVEKTDTCWIWIGCKSAGYGAFRVNRKNIRAHRFSYELYKGKIPSKLLVCHSCDNPICVNPSHLWLGTNLDNQKDCIKKGRRNSENNRSAKLSWNDVHKIRRLYADKKYNGVELSRMFGLTHSKIYALLNFKTWR